MKTSLGSVRGMDVGEIKKKWEPIGRINPLEWETHASVATPTLVTCLPIPLGHPWMFHCYNNRRLGNLMYISTHTHLIISME